MTDKRKETWQPTDEQVDKNNPSRHARDSTAMRWLY